MIEISRGDNSVQYRICPSDPLLIERKANQPGSRWCFYLRRDTAGETKRALLNIELVQEREEDSGKA